MKKKLSKTVIFFLKLVVLIVIFRYFFMRLDIKKLYNVFMSIKLEFFAGVTLFWLLGLTFNIYKWYFILNSHLKISLRSVIKSIFGGNALSLITPARLGEYGRFLFIKTAQKREIISLTVLDKIFNIFTISFFGVVVFFLKGNVHSPVLKYFLFFSFLLITVIIFLYMGNNHFLYKILYMTPFMKKEKKELYFRVFKTGDLAMKVKILSLSILTYLFFLFEFVFISLSIDGTTKYVALYGFIISLFLKTMIPLNIADWGVKEISLMEYYKLNGANVEVALLASMIIYILNILLPALIGWVIIFFEKEGYEK